MKVFEFAKKVGIQPMALMDKVKSWKLPVKSHMVELSPELIETISNKLEAEKEELKSPKSSKKTKKKASSKASDSKSKSKTKSKSKSKTKSKTKSKSSKKTAQKEAGTRSRSGTKVVKGVRTQKALTAKKATRVIKGTVTKTRLVTKSSGSFSVSHGGATTSQVTKVTSKTKTAEASKGKEEAKSLSKKGASKTILRRRYSQSPASAQSSAESSLGDPVSISKGGSSLQGEQAGQTGGGGLVGGIPSAENTFESLRKTTLSRENLKEGKSGSGLGSLHQGPEKTSASTNSEESKESKLPRRFEERSVSKKVKALTKEQESRDFSATDLRKREMVFVPRKKKVLATGEMKSTQITTPKAIKRVVKVHGSMQASELAQKIGMKWHKFRQVLSQNGMDAKPPTLLDFETVSLIIPEFGFEARNVSQTYESFLKDSVFGNLKAEPQVRPPVVTVMGHVDHGKTSLLDAIRSTNVTSKESGGITQHIGAYSVEVQKGRWITFIDTPGHAAFTAMRARGANVTDIVVLVTAADDGLMPQTLEAIHHARAAKVPILVAINKMDLPGANVEKVQKQLAEHNLLSEEWGGDALFCKVSALKKEGIQDLLEKISLLAEMAELRVNHKISASGVVIESRLEKGRGPVASLLVQEGFLEKGAFLAAGDVKGKARRLLTHQGKEVLKVLPGFVVEILGLEGIPPVGSPFHVLKGEKECQQALELWKQKLSSSSTTSPSSDSVASGSGSGSDSDSSGSASDSISEEKREKNLLESLFRKPEDEAKKLQLVLKVDVMGSGEAIKEMLNKISTEEVKVHFVHIGVGAISETDVLLASTTGAHVIGFNVRPYSLASEVAKKEKVPIKTYSIIYELVDNIKALMEGFLAPKFSEKTQGKAEVRDLFSVPKMGTIGGCSVIEGRVTRSSLLRLLRDGRIVYEGKVGSLRRFKDNVKEVAEGYECGIGIENFNDLKVGDVIEAYIKEEVQRTL